MLIGNVILLERRRSFVAEKEYKNSQPKIFVILVITMSFLFYILDDKDFPSWWFQELSIIAGLATFGVCYWLSGLIDDWLRRD